jgi:hypothetical protein
MNFDQLAIDVFQVLNLYSYVRQALPNKLTVLYLLLHGS